MNKWCPERFKKKYPPHPSVMRVRKDGLEVCGVPEFDCMDSHDCEKNHWNVPREVAPSTRCKSCGLVKPLRNGLCLRCEDIDKIIQDSLGLERYEN